MPPRSWTSLIRSDLSPGFPDWSLTDSIQDKRRVLDDLAIKLGIRRFSDFYKLSAAQLEDQLPPTIWGDSSRSLSSLLFALYPENDWLPWSFAKTSSSLWKDEAVVTKFFGAFLLLLLSPP